MDYEEKRRRLIRDIATRSKASSIPENVRYYMDPEVRSRLLDEGVGVGQLWVAETRLDATHVLVVNLREDCRAVEIVPMSLDLALQTGDSVIVAKSRTSLGLRMVAWPKLRAWIPVRLLKKPLGTFDERIMEAICSAPETQGRISGLARGKQPESLDSAVTERKRLAETMRHWHDELSRLPELPTSDETPKSGGADGNAIDMAGGRRMLESLTSIAGLSVSEALDVYRGLRALSESQKNRLAAAGVDIGVLAGDDDDSRLPADLLVEVEQPLWREAADVIDQRHHDDSPNVSGAVKDPRMELARAAFGLAARRSGSGRERWRRQLRVVVSEMGEM
ncbi:hypothetical protein [Bifidobacterium catulorum]|uniref:Uncharacterized protein n=1 Tax=Bifidobacterium catulorum TaxID=1630173 RepID=A0A2U2MU00_9BIFI|nr:hypothetical protein [Bifidobacterium catulorum]PWG60282.1 hypothetical protein DF200_03520 [Bifidobacterium catulorum]